MFEAGPSPRVFATPVGVDFCAALIAGLDARLQGQPPEAPARVEILVANERIQRRLHVLYLQRGPGLLPRIRPVLALAQSANLAGLPPAMTPLALRLTLSRLIAQLIETSPDIAPRAALYDLSDSLADFLGEMVEEGVSPADIAALDMGDHSEHWDRARAFLQIAQNLIDQSKHPTPEARQAMAVDRLIAAWRQDPPRHPVIVAGSTGSRRATFRLMEAVSGLPQGAVILPGLDRDLPDPDWAGLLEGRRAGLAGEDHPQFRLARFLDATGLGRDAVPDWGGGAPANPGRNRVVSLALRPAPMTDRWRIEGPRLPDVVAAMAGVTLLEAATPQIEASAIALRLRRAVEDGVRAALVTPDRTLARRVAAQLDRWGILPDDSAGEALDQTAPGRFLRQVAEAMAGPVTAEALVALLKHPLCHSGAGRGDHLRRTAELELSALRRGLAFPDAAALRARGADRGADRNDPVLSRWLDWISAQLPGPAAPGPMPLADRVEAHAAMAEALAAGPDHAGAGGLYDREAGAEAARLLADLRAEAAHGGAMSARDYADFFAGLAGDRAVRSALRPHAGVLVWGTQEARVQGAALTILGGLNEGTWPMAAAADPWLNRPLRAAAGLRLPDRVTGLSAHDFQQGIAGQEVWLTRARRNEETDTVPSRWLNRLINLLQGASASSKAALEEMRARGAGWLDLALTLNTPDAPQDPAPRPAPAPRSGPRLTRLSVTELETLIRDPYAVYAKHLLRLRKIDPLRPEPDARLRGTVIHAILEAFVRATPGPLPPDADALFLRLAGEVLRREAPWPATRMFWHGRLARVLPWYLDREAEFRALAGQSIIEQRAVWRVPGLDLDLIGKPDRIDLLPDGRVAIYDYKTGEVPDDEKVRDFDKQLGLLALMAEGGAFAGRPLRVARTAYVGLGTTPELRDAPVDADILAGIRDGLHGLLAHYRQAGTGFASRRLVTDARFEGDYDHLARHGEWDEAMEARLIPVGRAP